MRKLTGVTAVVAFVCLLGAGRVHAADAEPGFAELLLGFAPPGAWAVLSVDAGALRSMSALKNAPLAGPTQPELSRLDNLLGAAFFLLPLRQPSEGPPPWCGVLAMKSGRHASAVQRLAGIKQRQDVEGLSAYVSDRAAVAFLDDDTLLISSDVEALGAIIRAARAPNGEPDRALRDAAASVKKSAVFLAAAAPQGLGNALGRQAGRQLPDALLGARGISAGLTLGAQIELQATVRMADPDQAQSVSDAINQRLQAMNMQMQFMASGIEDEEMRAQFDAILSVYGSLQASAQSRNLRLTMSVKQEDMIGAAQALTGMMARARPRADGARRATPPPASPAPAPSATP